MKTIFHAIQTKQGFELANQFGELPPVESSQVFETKREAEIAAQDINETIDEYRRG